MIVTGVDQWTYATRYWGVTTPILYYRTDDRPSSNMDHYKVSSVNSWWGLTQFIRNGVQVNPASQDWVGSKVPLDGDFVNCPNKQGVIAHEQGHAMGLAHTFSGTNIMRADIGQGGLNWLTRAQPDDLYGINRLYG